MALRDNLEAVRERIEGACARAGRRSDDVTIVAVTKTHPAEVLHEVVSAGILDLGENRVQEALAKIREVPPQARIHLIGHLQSNKVNKAVGTFRSIVVDQAGVLERVARRAVGLEVVQPVWIQVNISTEPQKNGCQPAEVQALWSRALELDGLEPWGLMGIARLGALEKEARRDFATLRHLAGTLRRREGVAAWLSMGMSDDFEWAVLEGATHLRLGTVLLGPRT